MIRNETVTPAGVCIEADIYHTASGTYSKEEYGVVVETRPMTDADWLLVDPPPADGELVVSAWTIPADGVQHAVLTFGCGDDAAALFVVDGQVVTVPATRRRAVLEIAIDAPGAVDVRIRDKQVTIIGVAP